MASASFLEQAASSLSLSVTALVSVLTLAAIVLTFGVYRVLFPSETKPKSHSGSSKQHTGKDKKHKETTAKKQPAEEAPANKKKTNNKAKKNAVAVPSSATSQSEESEEEKVPAVQPTKKAAPAATANKSAAGKKAPSADADAKAAKATSDNKTASAKQQAAPARTENPSATQNADAKKKQTKAAEAPAPVKQQQQQQQQQPAGKNNASSKANAVAAPPAKKAVAAAASVESKPAAPVEEVAFEHEDEGPWVTQGGKQVNNRSRNKGKNESATTAPTTAAAAANATNHQQSPRAPPKRKGGAVAASKVDSDGETSGAASFDQPTPPPAPLEPIEVCQLLPSGENRYTSSDNWWKQPLNQQSTFSVTDIADWPERDQDEQYVVDKKRFMPVKKPTTNGKAALTEKDINVDAHAQGDEKVNFDEQAVAGESNGGSASQSKKKSTNVRRIS